MSNNQANPMEIQLRPEMEVDLYLKRRLGRIQTNHVRFSHEACPHWRNFTAQSQVCALALDSANNQIWVATWGGLLCWAPISGTCVHHTSEHGLVGNVFRDIAVDTVGTVWACNQSGELCSLVQGAAECWQCVSRLGDWKVERLITWPGGGVCMVLRNAQGRGALGFLVKPDAELCLILEGHRACVNVYTLLVDEMGVIWLGNIWGLYRYQGHDEPDYIDLSLDEQGHKGVHVRVQALACGANQEIWIGTNWGLYRWSANQPAHVSPIWVLADDIADLAWDPENNHLWVATASTVGRFTGQWFPLAQPLPCKKLLSGSINAIRHIWAASGDGLYELTQDNVDLALKPAIEDMVSNAVLSLGADQTNLWVGTARGLFLLEEAARYDSVSVVDGSMGQCSWNVRALLPALHEERVWVGASSSGLRSLRKEVDLFTVSSYGAHVIALAQGDDQTLWVATPEAVYWKQPGSTQAQWCPVPIEGKVVHALCYQPSNGANRQEGAILWIGTAQGLYAYRRGPNQLECVSGELQQLSILALALDPISQQLWIGTGRGLFRASDRQCQHTTQREVRALAFSQPSERTLWVGTNAGLEQWIQSQPEEDYQCHSRFTPRNSGLAAELVTALATRVGVYGREVWVGSLAGISRYRY